MSGAYHMPPRAKRSLAPATLERLKKLVADGSIVGTARRIRATEGTVADAVAGGRFTLKVADSLEARIAALPSDGEPHAKGDAHASNEPC